MPDPFGLLVYDGLRARRNVARAFSRWSDRALLFALLLIGTGFVADAAARPAREHLPVSLILCGTGLAGLLLGRAEANRVARLASDSVMAAHALSPAAGASRRAVPLLAVFALLPAIGWVAGIVELRRPDVLAMAAVVWAMSALVGGILPAWPKPVLRIGLRGRSRISPERGVVVYPFVWGALMGLALASLTLFVPALGAGLPGALAGFGAAACARVSPAVCRFHSYSGTSLARHVLEAARAPAAAVLGALLGVAWSGGAAAAAAGGFLGLALMTARLLHYRQMSRAQAERQLQLLLVAVAFAATLAPPAAVVIGGARLWRLMRADHERLWSLG